MLQLSVLALYTSLEFSACPFSSPPATNTVPLGSNVAVCPSRELWRLPVNAHVPLAPNASVFAANSVPAIITSKGSLRCVILFSYGLAPIEKARAVPEGI